MRHYRVLAAFAFTFVGLATGSVSALALEIFRATPPYGPAVGTTPHVIELGGKSRTFDFGGGVPFLNTATGVADFATINVWNPGLGRGQTISGAEIPADGVKHRIFKTQGYTAIGYLRGDGIVEGKLRAQLNSFPIPARQHYIWELSFRLGGAELSEPWAITSRGLAPATLWQLKTTGLPPSLVMAVDTDPNNPSKLALNFDSRLDPSKPASRLGDIGNLDPSAETSVRIDAFLDERPALQGKGFVRIWVNNQLIVDRWGPVLQESATFPYHWSLAMYLYNNTEPLDVDRFVYWKKARMLVDY